MKIHTCVENASCIELLFEMGIKPSLTLMNICCVPNKLRHLQLLTQQPPSITNIFHQILSYERGEENLTVDFVKLFLRHVPFNPLERQEKGINELGKTVREVLTSSALTKTTAISDRPKILAALEAHENLYKENIQTWLDLAKIPPPLRLLILALL